MEDSYMIWKRSKCDANVIAVDQHPQQRMIPLNTRLLNFFFVFNFSSRFEVGIFYLSEDRYNEENV